MRATSRPRSDRAGAIHGNAVVASATSATRSNHSVSRGIVRVRDDQRNVDAVRAQHPQAADADVVVGEDDGARHRAAVSG